MGLYNLVKSSSPGITGAFKSRSSSGIAAYEELTTPATPATPALRLAGGFSGGIPKLRSRGGVDTGGVIQYPNSIFIRGHSASKPVRKIYE